MSTIIKEKNPVSPRKRVNSQCTIAMTKLNELKFEIILHPPYSSDLVLSDFFLFPNLKNDLKEKYFNKRCCQRSRKWWFFSSGKPYFSNRMKGLEKRWTKCIELQRLRLKIKSILPKKLCFSLLGQIVFKSPSYIYLTMHDFSWFCEWKSHEKEKMTETLKGIQREFRKYIDTLKKYWDQYMRDDMESTLKGIDVI